MCLALLSCVYIYIHLGFFLLRFLFFSLTLVDEWWML